MLSSHYLLHLVIYAALFDKLRHSLYYARCRYHLEVPYLIVCKVSLGDSLSRIPDDFPSYLATMIYSIHLPRSYSAMRKSDVILEQVRIVVFPVALDLSRMREAWRNELQYYKLANIQDRV